MYVVYIIGSETTGRWYYGHTGDLVERMASYNGGRSMATKGRGPWRLIATKGFPDRSGAIVFELSLKKCKRKELALRMITV